jgi:acyl-CoA thioester hydrolase
MPPEDQHAVETRLRVRYAETDAMRIVHHGSYITYFEEGRSSYIRQRGHSYALMERSGFFLAVTEVCARYLKPAVYDEELLVVTWLSRLMSRGLTFEYEIVHAEDRSLLVTGMSKHVCIDASGQPARIPETWREALKD